MFKIWSLKEIGTSYEIRQNHARQYQTRQEKFDIWFCVTYCYWQKFISLGETSLFFHPVSTFFSNVFKILIFKSFVSTWNNSRTKGNILNIKSRFTCDESNLYWNAVSCQKKSMTKIVGLIKSGHPGQHHSKN